MNKKQTNETQPAKENRGRDHQEQWAQAHLISLIKTRANAEGITIDPTQTQLIDDGIWIEKNQATGGWTVNTYIADVPAILPLQSPLAQAIQQKFQDPQKIIGQQNNHQIRNFPQHFLNKFVSLKEGQARPVVAFNMELSKDGLLSSCTITREIFTNLRKCNHTPLRDQFRPLAAVAHDWYRLAHKMQESRLNSMADECDRVINPQAPRLNLRSALPKSKHPSELLVQELMRLTNAAAADYMVTHKLPMPVKHQSSGSEIVFRSKDPAFESATDARCHEVINKYQIGKNPKIRLSSPMRIYGDYVSMQILTRHLEGFPESPELEREARRLTTIFHQAASKQPATNRPAWRYSQVENSHPFNYLTRHPGDRQSSDLQDMGRDNGWDRADVSIRKIHVKGARFYLVGVQQKTSMLPEGASKAWAVAMSYENAREQASHRVLQELRQTFLQPKSSPGRQP